MSQKRWMPGIVIVVCALLVLTGCESFRRKFVRTKKSDGKAEPMVIVPRDYSAHPFPNDVLYRQYFTYWKAWSQEWARSLDERASHKKTLDCARQSLLNLSKMKGYLNEDEAAGLDVYVQKTARLKEQIEAQPNALPSQGASWRYSVDRIQSAVSRQFDGRKMKDAIRPGPGAEAA